MNFLFILRFINLDQMPKSRISGHIHNILKFIKDTGLYKII